MSAKVWPPISQDELIREEEKSLACELECLLDNLQDTFASLKSGLQECRVTLFHEEPGSTLALSSPRSECVKGFVTRVGMMIVRGDIQIRLQTLPPPRSLPAYPLHIRTPLMPMEQLWVLYNLLNQASDIVTFSTWTDDPHNASFIAGQLRLLAEAIDEARQVMKGGEDAPGKKWWEDWGWPEGWSPFSPLPPSNLSVHWSLQDAALVLHLRTFTTITNTATPTSDSAPSSFSGFSLRQRLGLAPRLPTHDEAEQIFVHVRYGEVRVREKVRVESTDPSLLALSAKLNALAHSVRVWRRALAAVMGDEEGEG